MNDEPFGRQPLPVEVIISGTDARDVRYWAGELMRRGESHGDMVQAMFDGITTFTFKIYPRAVND